MATITAQPARTGRLPELALLVLAWAITAFSYVLISLNRFGHIRANIWLPVGILIGGSLLAHLAIRRLAPYADPILLPTAVTLNGLGLAMIYRLDISYQALGQKIFLVGNKQLLYTVAGIIVLIVALFVIRDHRILRPYRALFLLASLLLLALPMVPGLGLEINGARIWINLGIATFQPAELTKITLAIFFAAYLDANRDALALAGRKIWRIRLPRARDMGPILLAWVVSLGVLVVQKDLGTALMLFGLFVAVLYVATARVSWLLIGGALFIPGALVTALKIPHVGARFDIWVNALSPELYNREFGGSGQLVQGLFGMANGGLMGTGWGKGYPQFAAYANSDFIMPSFGEELGFTGLAAILVLFALLVMRGFRAAALVRDGFGKLLASGLAFGICLQVFVVVGGVTRLIPLTGLTTPFLAAGGSSLLANWIILALLLRISDASRRPVPGGPAGRPLIDPGLVPPEPPELKTAELPESADTSDAPNTPDTSADNPTQVVPRI